MKTHRYTKIVATLGPSSSTYESISGLQRAGVNVFRLNFSHGSHAEHRDRYEIIRAVERETKTPIAVMMDLQGPKLRIGQLENGRAELLAGGTFRLDMTMVPGTSQRVSLPHPEIFAALKPGSELLLDDGKLVLQVREAGPDYAETEVLVGGVLSDRKGVSLPGLMLPISALTDKDRADLEFGLSLGVDWVALSFVQRPEDLREARGLIRDRAAIIAKLEKPAAIDALDEIIALSDGVMVARGDLGVEMQPEEVPVLQHRIIAGCRERGRPVIVATQMLESMIAAPTPTRAEANDVATAVYAGADAVMLSAETAAGKYPCEAVRIMSRIITRVQSDSSYWTRLANHRAVPDRNSADAISIAARQIGETLDAGAIATYTTSGSTTYRVARNRPALPIIGLTPNINTLRRLPLIWGVTAIHARDATDIENMMTTAADICRSHGYANSGDRIVITAGVPFAASGTTNLLRIARV